MKTLARRLLFLLPALVAAWPVQADIYTCRTPKGETMVSDKPCERGAVIEQVSPSESAPSLEKAQADLQRQKAWADQRSAEHANPGPRAGAIPYQPAQLSPYAPPSSPPVTSP